MRKRTFLDTKFSQGDANSQAYRDNWDAIFGQTQDPPKTPATVVTRTDDSQTDVHVTAAVVPTST